MIQGSLARRYAKAVLALATESGEMERVRQEIVTFVDLLDTNPKLFQTLCQKTLPSKERRAVLKALLLQLRFSDTVENFLLLVLEKNRLPIIGAICRELLQLADVASGRLKARVRTARKLPDASRREITQALEKTTGKKIDLEETVDPRVIGGLSTQLGNTVFDGTVATQIEKMKRQMLQKNFNG